MGRNKKRKKQNHYDNFAGGSGYNGNNHTTDEMNQQAGEVSMPLREFYVMNEHLGSENRSTEFKNGPGFIKHNFRENVAKYVCGFVNSQENGKLLIGIDDGGFVSGYDCTHNHEDRIRRDIDEAVKDIIPSLFPGDYLLRFVPVHDESNQPLGNTKVIEISVQGANIDVKGQLYSNKQGVFMRRDGSIQELKAHEIQEWTRRKFQGELDKQKKNQENVEKELKDKTTELKQLEEKLQQKNEELQRRDESLRQREQEEEKRRFELEQHKSLLNRLSDKNRELEDQINVLKQKSDGSGAQGSSQLLEKMERMEVMMKEQNERLANQKQSKVCVIS